MPLHVGIVLDAGDIAIQQTAELISWCIGAEIHYITLYDVAGELKCRQHVLESSLSASNKAFFGKLAALLEVSWWAGKGVNAEEPFCAPNEEIPKNSKDTNTKHNSNSSNNLNRAYNIYITSYEDGKPQIVEAARRICRAVEDKRITSKEISYAVVESNIRAYPVTSTSTSGTTTTAAIPDPDFILNFDESGMLCGFMPWHIRLTEILHMGSLRDICVDQLIDALYLYSKCERRHGT